MEPARDGWECLDRSRAECQQTSILEAWTARLAWRVAPWLYLLVLVVGAGGASQRGGLHPYVPGYRGLQARYIRAVAARPTAPSQLLLGHPAAPQHWIRRREPIARS